MEDAKADSRQLGKLRMGVSMEEPGGHGAGKRQGPEYMAQTKSGNLIGYLLEYKKHPAAENLVTGGFAWLLEEYITGGYGGMEPAAINWKEAKPMRMLGLEKWEAGHWRNNRGTMGLSGLVAYRKVKAALGRPVRPEEWNLIWHWPLHLTEELLKREEGRNYLRDLRYLIKRRRRTRTFVRGHGGLSAGYERTGRGSGTGRGALAQGSGQSG